MENAMHKVGGAVQSTLLWEKTIPHDRENWETNTTNDKYQLKTNRPRARRHSREVGIGEKLRAQLW